MILTKQELQSIITIRLDEEVIKSFKNICEDIYRKLGITINTDGLLGNLIEILEEDPNFCYIFAKDKNDLYISKELTDLSDTLFIRSILYIYNPIKEKFELFFKDGHIDYPDWLKSVSASAFRGCNTLISITIPDSVTRIGDDAFEHCENLTDITIPNSVTTIGDSAFEYCENLTNITIPNSVFSIGDSAFYRCKNLTSITIPDNVTSISNFTFGYCENLKTILISDNVTKIHGYTFYNCPNLTVYTNNEYVIKYCKNNDIKYTES